MRQNEHPLLKEARELLPGAVQLRRQIHRHPELGNETPKTRAAVLETIADLDLDIALSNRTSGLIARLQGAHPGPEIVLRGDMDALPMPEHTGVDFASQVEGRMHACGHDAHTAMLATVARLLHGRRSELSGSVRFMFQPGEEGPGGAHPMIDEGLVEGDACFALHIYPNYRSGIIASRPGPIMAGADDITIRIIGRGGHGAMPHLANDPMPVACEVVLALQTFIARRVGTFQGMVITVGTLHSGTANNIIPDEVTMGISFRYLDEETRAVGYAAMRRISSQIAAAHEMAAAMEINPGYPATFNDAAFTKGLEASVSSLLGNEGFYTIPEPIMGSEDFSYVLQKIPGAFAFLGVAPKGVNPDEAHACHSTHMMLDEDAMAMGIATHAKVALDFLNRGQ